MYKITELYDLEHTLAKPYLEQFEYPWEALKGLKDYIVIDTDDVLLICPRVDNPLKELMPKLAMPRYDKFR